MLVKTLRRHGYDKQIRVQDEEYEIENKKHVRILEAVGKIRRIPEVIFAPAEKAFTPVEKQPVKKAVKKKPAKKKSGKYKRKDMVAE